MVITPKDCSLLRALVFNPHRTTFSSWPLPQAPGPWSWGQVRGFGSHKWPNEMSTQASHGNSVYSQTDPRPSLLV